MFVCLIILPLSRVLKLLIHDFTKLLIFLGRLVLLGVWISQIVGEGKICNFYFKSDAVLGLLWG
jgi:hypothetical protein